MTGVKDGEVVGEARLVSGPGYSFEAGTPRRASAALIAARIAGDLDTRVPLTMLVSTSEVRADEIGRALAAMVDPGVEVLVLPPWDCLPYDHASPSRESQGRRLDVFARLASRDKGRRVLVTSPEALMQRLASEPVREMSLSYQVGQDFDAEALEAFALRTGYVADDRIDEPGEIAILGEVVDIFPASAPAPVRFTLTEGRIGTMKLFDPLTQRTGKDIQEIVLRPASERLSDKETPREPGMEHRLGEDGPLETLFDLAGRCVVRTEPDALERCLAFVEQVREAHVTARTFGSGSATLSPPEALYLSAAEIREGLADASPVTTGSAQPVERFALHRSPGRALKAFIAERTAARFRVVFAGIETERKLVARLMRRQGLDLPAEPSTWAQSLGADPGVTVLDADIDAGFDASDLGVVLVAAGDVLGGRIADSAGAARILVGEPDLRVGDVVIHEDHGLGVLESLERIDLDGLERDVLRLRYHGDTTILAPVEEFGRIWRYGSEPDVVTLDRIGSDAWRRRRAEVSLQIDATATRLVEMAREREALRVGPVSPPRQALARFNSGFPFPESADQSAAIAAVMADLASGRPMDRLVCGDVGFGKTEVALRAAAAVALSGRQVVVAAPTTVLARQHYATFSRRFRDTGLTVAHLSRLVDAGEAARVRSGLADGAIDIVVGTQALGSETLSFSDLGLVIIDEEQRFGSKLKETLRGRGAHALTLTATPIPRTLQSALMGLMDVSVIASPPARRRPIRTALTGFDEASVRTALLQEKRRGGQSFVVCPRIEDIEPMGRRLERLAPELSVVTVHGKMPVAQVDEAMVNFAEGRGDVLLATNIIESGLDVPRANTIVVWRPDRFGLAQLHQLRGRVGRGRLQGFAYLLTDPDDEVGAATLSRLSVLEAFDRLGSGFAISARDLDLRGGGDLIGDEQAGHMKMIGSALYQRVLEMAVRTARGESLPESPPPPKVDANAFLCPDYIPDATVRINLYARMARVESAAEAEALEDEIADRFGPPPPPVSNLLDTIRMTALAAEAGVVKIVSGPKATAFTVSASKIGLLKDRLAANDERRWVDDRLIYDARDDDVHDAAFLAAVLSDLAA